MPLLIHRREAQHDLPLDPSLHPLLQRIYRQRHLQDSGQLQLVTDRLLSPEQLSGIDAAVQLLCRKLERQERVLIVADFDADGATSCALGVLALRALGFTKVDYIVPNRFTYGYGLTPEIVAFALTRDPQLIITVDNGISSLDGVAAANAAGVEVLITDHHLPGDRLPRASAIVNPNQPGCTFPSKSLAGVGVIFYLMLALRGELRRRGRFVAGGLREPNLAELLDLVALGTVADVVPLDYNNRILVSEGLRRIRGGRCRPGITTLLELGNRNRETLVAADLGFAVGPRLNAAGRLDDMSLGIECLLTDDPAAAHRMALELDALNRDRKHIEGGMRDQAFADLDRLSLGDSELPAGLCLFDAAWHQGVIGILASRIKDKYHRPAIAFAAAEEQGDGGEIKGSARSIPGYHIRDALDAIAKRHPDLLGRFGGHAMAAGLSIRRDDFERFARAFAEHAGSQLDAGQLRLQIDSDGPLSAADFDMETAAALLEGGPWGQGFPEPVFDGEFAVLEQRQLNGGHLKFQLGYAGLRERLDAIAFNLDESLLGMQFERLKLVYKLDINVFRGQRKLQLKIEHLEPMETGNSA